MKLVQSFGSLTHFKKEVTFTMNAFNKGGRFIHIMGTKGEVRAAIEEDSPITVYNFSTKETEEIAVSGSDGVTGGHGGGDEGILSLKMRYEGDAVGPSCHEPDADFLSSLEPLLDIRVLAALKLSN